jgi:RTX calcium-binding nonapeptide repeat (4 copies)
MRFMGVAIVAASILFMPAAAEAATVSHDGSRIYFTAGGGENNYLRITVGDCDVPCLSLAEDGGATIELDPDTEVAQRCVRDPLPSFADHVVYCEWAPTTVDAGDGSDLIEGGPTSDTIGGGPGNDQLLGNESDDALDGGPGDDALDTKGFSNDGSPGVSSGADDLRGGDGNDLVSYYSLATPLNLSLDDQANDAGGDNVHSDVEHLEGSKADDTITGNGGPNKLSGAGGTDVISGGAGNDDLNGDVGIDQLSGDAGNDTVNGGSNGDVIDGGPGVDSLAGDTTCEQPGCGGPDHIRARDGEGDNVVCRADADTVEADNLDAVAGDCEMVDRAGAGGGGGSGGAGGGGGGTGDGPVITAGLSGRAPRISHALNKGVTLSYSCDEACAITGQAVVSGSDAKGLKLAKTVVVAKGKSSLTAAGKGKLKLKFTRKAKKKLRSRKKLKLKVTLVAVDAAGNKSALTRTVTLKR